MITHDKLAEAVQLLKISMKFANWRPESKQKAKTAEESWNDGSLLKLEQGAAEKHYTPQDLAEMWGVSVQTIREIFQNEEGVLKIGRDGTRTRRRYKTLRIPESVAERVHTRLSA